MAAKAIYDYCFPENEESAQSGSYQERYCLITKNFVEDADMIRRQNILSPNQINFLWMIILEFL